MSEKKQVLGSIAALAKKLGRTPSLLEFVAKARIKKCSVMRHFAKWNVAVKAAGLEPCRVYVRLANSDLLKRTLKDRPVYGNPIHFRGLRHEPVNEQGVVLLFGMVAKEVGYMVEAVQTGFPDCEAKRQIAPDRWQRVRIEFEYESKNFHQHGHPVSGCDVIVCWRHNWDKCPKHLEVVELSNIVDSLARTEGGLLEKPRTTFRGT